MFGQFVQPCRRTLPEMTPYEYVESKAVPADSAIPPRMKAVPRAPPSIKSARKRGRGKKAGKRGKMPKTRKGLLSNVSANSVSLQDAADFAGVVWKYGKYALAAINAEEKESYVLVKDGATASFIQFVSGIAQGLDYNQRTGDSVKVTNVRMEYVLVGNVTAGANISRLIILRDFMNQGSQPVNSDIFQDTSTATATIASPYLHNLADRFEVLYDQVETQTYTSESTLVHRRIGMAINDHVLFKGTSAATSDSWQGAFYVVFITDQAVNAPKLTLSIMFNYVDN